MASAQTLKGVSEFANTGLTKKAEQAKSNYVLEAISRNEATADDQGQARKCNSVPCNITHVRADPFVQYCCSLCLFEVAT